MHIFLFLYSHNDLSCSEALHLSNQRSVLSLELTKKNEPLLHSIPLLVLQSCTTHGLYGSEVGSESAPINIPILTACHPHLHAGLFEACSPTGAPPTYS